MKKYLSKIVLFKSKQNIKKWEFKKLLKEENDYEKKCQCVCVVLKVQAISLVF